MTLCQNINLVAGSKYTLSFDIYAYFAIQNLTAKAYLNDILLTKLYIANRTTFGNQVFSFYVDRNLNSFCFNETHSAAPPFPYYDNGGGFIDNVSLILVEKIYINFNCVVN